MSQIDKSIQTESKLVLPRVWRVEGRWRVTATVYGVVFCDHEN